MISQAMESRSPQLIQTNDVPSGSLSVDELINVEDSPDVNPYCHVRSPQADLLDIANIVLVSDCISSKDSLGTMRDGMYLNDITRECENYTDNFKSCELAVKGTYLNENSCESVLHPSKNHVTWKKANALPVNENNVCDQMPNSCENLYEIKKLSDTAKLTCRESPGISNNVESCGCGDSYLKFITPNVFQKSANAEISAFPTEIAYITEISTSDSDKDVGFWCPEQSTDDVQTSESSKNVYFTSMPDSIFLPSTGFQLREMDMKANDGNQVSLYHATTCNPPTDCEMVISVNDDVVQPLSVVGPREMEMKSVEKNEVVPCPMSVTNVFDGDHKVNVLLVENNVVEPAEALELSKIDMKPEEKSNVLSPIHMNVVNLGIVEDNVLQYPSVLESCEMDIRSEDKSRDISFPVSTTNVFRAAVIGDAVVQLPSFLESCEMEIKSEGNKDSLSPTRVTNVSAVIVEDDVAKPSSFVELFETDRKSEETKEVALCPTGITDDLDVYYKCAALVNDSGVHPFSAAETHMSKTKPEEESESSMKISFRHEFDVDLRFDVMVDNNFMHHPVLDSCEMGVKQNEQNNFICQTDTRNSFDAEDVLNGLVTNDTFVLTSPVMKHQKINAITKEGIENLPPNITTTNINGSDKCSFSQRYHSEVDEPDVELTKHLMHGLSFFTPVRDILKSLRLLSPRTTDRIESTENHLFSSFAEVQQFENSGLCSAGLFRSDKAVDSAELCSDSFSVGSEQEVCDHVDARANLRKKCLRFGSITVYYFPRTQGFTAVSSDGGVALGMEQQHCDVKLHTLSDYAMQKHQISLKSSHRKHKKKRMSSSFGVDCESHKAVQILPPRKRTSLLRAAGIRDVDHGAIQEAAAINASRLLCGCFCVDVCLPAVCFCARMEIECLIDREGFPCKCSEEGCGNPSGRSKFSPNKVHLHYIHTVARLQKVDTHVEERSASPTSQESDRPQLPDGRWGEHSMHSAGPGPRFAVGSCIFMETFPPSVSELSGEV